MKYLIQTNIKKLKLKSVTFRLLLLLSIAFFGQAEIISATPTMEVISVDNFENTTNNKCVKNYFIDQSLEDQVLLQSIPTEHLETFHLMSHGQPGQLLINGQWLAPPDIAQMLQTQAAGFKKIAIYGCNFAQGEKGKAAVSYLETALSVSIAASDDITGKDGDWDLEVGQNPTTLFVENYNDNLVLSSLWEDFTTWVGDFFVEETTTTASAMMMSCAGTVGGTDPTDDFDGDGYCNNVDLDDDNDGILDTDECGSFTIDPDPSSSNYFNTGFFNSSLNLPQLTSGTCWSPATANTNQHVGMMFNGRLLQIIGVTTKGRGNSAQWVTSYELEATKDGTTWVSLGTYTANNNQNTEVFNAVTNTDDDWTGLRINPETWNSYPSLRFQFQVFSNCDVDDDNISNQFDLDSDADGCPDAIEGGGSFTTSDIDGSDMLTGGVDGDGIPTAATASGQTVGDSQDAATQSADCPCTGTVGGTGGFDDFDGDSICNIYDLDDDNDGILDGIECPPTTMPFTYTGTNQTFTVPPEVTSITTKGWGAGGASKNGAAAGGTDGGGGAGYAEATFDVTPGDILTLIVGQGGQFRSTSSTFGGGGAGGTSVNVNQFEGSSGGGRSTLLINGIEVLTAGGGGGASGGLAESQTSFGGAGGGGAIVVDGGGNSHQEGAAGTVGAGDLDGILAPGQGATVSGGGAAGCCEAGAVFGTDGTAFQGGHGANDITNNTAGGGGGGGGHFGGGGGIAQTSTAAGVTQDRAGGGGSSFISSSATSFNFTGGSGSNVGNAGDADYIAGVGVGATGNGNVNVANATGGNGLIVITYTVDTDLDGYTDAFDLDSDNDGCPDATEGGGSFNPSNINGSDMLTGGVDANGVPTIATASGQTIGDSQDDMVQPLTCPCTGLVGGTAPGDDFDDDGYCNDEDLDDDNDGILDVDEILNELCNNSDFIDINFTSLSINNGSDGDVNSFYTGNVAPGVDIKITIIGNSNGGTSSSDNDDVDNTDWTNVLEFAGAGFDYTEYLIEFFDSSTGNPVNVSFVWTNTDIDGSSAGGRAEGVAYLTPDAIVYNSINDLTSLSTDVSGWFNVEGSYSGSSGNTFIDDFSVSAIYNEVSSFSLRLGGYGTASNRLIRNVGDCDQISQYSDPIVEVFSNSPFNDIDNDNISNQFDLDSDGDSCPDAIEGGGSFTTSDIDGSDMLTGGIDVNGVPTAATASGQTIGDSEDAATQSVDCPLPINTTLAENDINQTPEGTTVSGNVLTNDSDGEGDAQTVQSATYLNPSGVVTNLPLGTATDVYDASGTLAGSMEINTDGTYEFIPAAGFTGEVPVDYVVVDDNDNPITDEGSLSIEVIETPSTDGSNNAPIAQDDTNTTEQGASVTTPLLSNDSDPDGDALTVSTASGLDGSGNAVTLTATPQDIYDENGVLAGQASIDASGNVTFTADTDFEGEVPVSYTATDGTDTDDGTLVITVDPADATDNDTYANDDASTGTQGNNQTGNVLANDNDPAGTDQDIASILVDTDGDGTPEVVVPVAGTPTDVYEDTDGDGTPELIGTIDIDPETGAYTFDPTDDFVGTADIPYVATNGTVTDEATLYVTSLPNENTTVAENDINQTPEGTTVSGNVLTNDSDGEGDAQTVQSATYLNASGVVTNLPLGTATDVYDASGTLAGSMEINTDGSYEFIPAAGFTGEVPVDYVVVDDNDNPITDEGSLSIEVIETPSTDGSNNAPIAQDDTNTTEQGASVTTPLLSNDSDPDGDALTVSTASGLDGSGNAVTLTATPQDIYDENGVLAGQASIDASGNLTFTADTDFEGEVPVSYTATDGTDTDDATLVITVDPADATDNDTYANNDASTGTQGNNQTGNVLTNDNDPAGTDQDIASILVDTDGDGTPEVVVPVVGTPTDIYEDTDGDGTPELIGTIDIDPETGAYTFDPTDDFVGTADIPYVATNGTVTDEATLYVTSLPNENTTLAENDINQTPEGTTVSGNVLTNDSDEQGDSQTVQSATYLNASGVVTNLPLGTATDVYDASGTLAGSMEINTDGSYEFIPATGFTGEVPVDYVVVDDNDNPITDEGSLSIEVIETPSTDGSNNAPIAQDDTNTTEQGASVTTPLLSNDSDPDGDALTVSTASGLDNSGNAVTLTATPQDIYDENGVLAGQASIDASGNVTFTADTDFEGEVPVSYTATDGTDTDDGTLVITIDPADATDNDTYANDDASAGLQDEDVTGNVLTNDNDPDSGETQTVSAATSSAGITITPGAGLPTTLTGVGTIEIATDGTYTFNPDPTFIGTEVIKYVVCDDATPTVVCDTASLYLTVLEVPACSSGSITYAITDGTNNTTGYQWDNSSAPASDVPSTLQYGLHRSTDYCDDGTWRHYYNSNEPNKFLFSVDMGSNTTEIEYIDIRVDQNPSSRYDSIPTSAMFVMERDWHVETVGGAALTAPVNIRFYYPPSELQKMLDAAIAKSDTDPSSTAPTAADIVWFKKETFNPTTDIDATGSTLTNGTDYLAMTPIVAAGANGIASTETSSIGNNTNYVQFDGVTNFSGGTAFVLISGTTLPVELSEFKARANGCNVDLTWVTESEKDFDYFELEWSGDGLSFELIEKIEAKGGDFTQLYHYKDQASSSFNYYRLKMVDLDGSYQYSRILQSDTECASTNEILIYPNPVSNDFGILNVKFYSERPEAQLQITDMVGRVVKRLTLGVEAQIVNNVGLDISDLPFGTYTLQLIGNSETKVFIVKE